MATAVAVIARRITDTAVLSFGEREAGPTTGSVAAATTATTAAAAVKARKAVE